MFADPKKVGTRRLKRQLKAAASILVAVAAGAFLACKGEREPGAASPYGPDARGGPGARRDGGAAREGTAAPDAGQAGGTATDAGAGTSLVVRDAAVDAHAQHVDKHEHRKGMPVRDNLLE